MNPAAATTWVCSHTDIVNALLGWLLAAGGASALTYFKNIWDKLPPGLQVILHLVALNIPQAFTNSQTNRDPPPPPAA